MFKISVVGHRSLKKKHIKTYRKMVYKQLLNLQKKHSTLIIYSALADGSDRLVVEEALKLNIGFIAVLPMKCKIYEKDFNVISQTKFYSLMKKAIDIIEIPHQKVIDKDVQYKLAGHLMSDSCDVLLTLWDGKYNNLIGGTSEIVKYHMSKEGYLIYHLLVSRQGDLTNNMIKFKTYQTKEH